MSPSDTRHHTNGAGSPASADPGPLVPAAQNTGGQDIITAPVAAHTQCDECGAPVEEEQRYCVVCGAHRRHVNDPAGRYLSEASARARNARMVGTARRVRRSEGRARGLGVAVALALIPAAAAVGVVLGRSSNNDDAQLVQALSREQTAADRSAAVSSTGAAASTSTSTNASTGAGVTRHSAGHTATAGHHKASSHHATRTASHAATSTTASSIPTKPTAAQKATGAKETQKVQKSTGKGYVSGQSGLPGTVVVP